MNEETLSRIFQPFVQAENTLARTQGGLGLGLALIKNLVELHEGSVEASSEGLGKGTEFTMPWRKLRRRAQRPRELSGAPRAGDRRQ